MIEKLSKEQCTGCAACSNICPKHCITMESDQDGFLYPHIDHSSCINCKLCEQTCPPLNTRKVPMENWPEAFLAWSKDKNALEAATSGGVFTSIALEILQEGGVVAGAAYDKNFVVRHTVIDNEKDLFSISRSKYVQSSIGDVYSQVGEHLRQQKKVLFCGTPCQVYGLKAYCRKRRLDESKLYTMDLVCHGTPSPKLLSEYIKYQERIQQAKVSKIMMREKLHVKSFFTNPGTKVEFSNGAVYDKDAGQDYYGRLFWGEISSRPSCFSCAFKTIGRISDMTLGDCWFSRSLSGKKDIPFEVTLCLVHTEKGRGLLTDSRLLSFAEVDAEKAVKCNGGMIYSSAVPDSRREAFFAELGQVSLDVLAEKYFPQNKKSENGMKKLIKGTVKAIPGVYRSYFFKQKAVEFENRCKKMIPDSAMTNQNL